MTPLTKPVRRTTQEHLSSFWGPWRNRPIVVSLEPGDLISFRPLGIRKSETVRIEDMYRYAVMCATNRTKREKEAVRKAKKAEAQERARLKRELRKPAVKL